QAAADLHDTARALLFAFLSDVIDAAVRAAAPHALRTLRRPNVESQWLAALFALDPRVDLRPAKLESFRQSLDTWQRPLHVMDDAGYRVCFRLEPPESADAGPSPAAAPRQPRGEANRRAEGAAVRDWL